MSELVDKLPWVIKLGSYLCLHDSHEVPTEGWFLPKLANILGNTGKRNSTLSQRSSWSALLSEWEPPLWWTDWSLYSGLYWCVLLISLFQSGHILRARCGLVPFNLTVKSKRKGSFPKEIFTKKGCMDADW